MLARWLIRYLWRPFELQCRVAPIWPLRASLDEPVQGVTCVRIGNGLTRALSKLAGGYDYAVCYVIGDAVLVDTGYAWAGRELRRILIQKGWDRSLQAVLNTHYHEDHVGNNDIVAAITEARIYGSPITTAEIRLPPHLPWYRRFLFGPSAPARIEVAPERFVVNGMEFLCLETPGHCPGHLCLFMPATGWLFSGDLFVSSDLDTQLPDVDGPAWIGSLRQVLALPATAMFDSHGTVLLGPEAVRGALQSKLDFLCGIERRVREQLGAATSIEDLSSRVFSSRTWGERLALGDGWLSVPTSADFSRHHLVASFARHILLAEGAGKRPS
jgi:glyoxylase-like metal-dependent hydrolase (beta-lactamase superfamily II)